MDSLFTPAMEAALHQNVPEHNHVALRRYLFNGIIPGSFLKAVLENNLFLAVRFADAVNKRHLASIVEWLYQYAPAECFGRPEYVAAWHLSGGIEGSIDSDDAQRITQEERR